MSLHEVQVYLDREGASELVAELVMKSSLSPNVFMEAVQLGIALLEGGNPVIQRSLFTKLQSAETSPIFFKVGFFCSSYLEFIPRAQNPARWPG